MPLMTAITGLLLIILGLVGFIESGSQAKTALIPSAFGVAFALLGVMSFSSDGVRKHAMHITAALALIGTVLPVFRIVTNYSSFNIQELKGFSLFLMAVFCMTLLAMCVNSFVQARKAQADAGNPPTPIS